jgi:hypothetical protein
MAAWLLMLGAGGCAYQQKDVFPPDVATIALPIFENRSFYPRLELDITEALTKEVETRTPYKVVRRNSADTLLEGTIVSVSQRQLSRQPGTGLPNEVEMQIEVNFVWKDMRSGEILRERRGFRSVGRYIPARVVGDTLKVAEFEVAQRLAQDVVSAMRVGM